MPVGTFASAVHIAAPTCTDVITLEPFNNFTDNSWTLTNTPTIVAGRTGTAANFFSTSQRADYNIAAPSQSDTVTFGFAWRHTDASTVNRNICQLYSDDGATQHSLLQWNKATGLLIFTRGGATIGSTTFAGVQNTWYYIEIQAKLHDSTGFGIVRIDGAEVINTGAVDTKGGGTKTVYDQLRILAGVTSLTNQYDDLYLRTGSTCTFRGDINPPVCTDVITLEPFNNFTDNSWVTSGSPTIVAGGRNGNGLQIISQAHYASYNIAGGAQSDTVTVGFAWRRTDAATTERYLCLLLSDSGGLVHNRLTCTPSTTTLAFTRSSTSIASNTAVTFTQNQWYYIEVQAKLHDTAGSVIIRVDGVEIINATSLDTRNAGTSPLYDQLRLQTFGVSCTGQWDDLYLSTGSTCTFDGDPTPTPRYFKTALGNNALVATATSLAITTTNPIAIGDLVVVRVASDNLSASTPTYTCADSGGNTYTTHSERASGQATGGAGVAGGLMATKATSAVAAGSTITVTASATVTNLVVYAESFVGFNNTTRSTPVTAVGAVAGGTGVSVVSGTVNSGDLVLGSAHAETRTAPASGDADTLNGSWSTISSVPSSVSGTDNLRTIVAGQYKIATASGAQTWDIVNGVAADWSAVIVVLQAT